MGSEPAMVRDLNDRLYVMLRDLRSSSGQFGCECGDASCGRSVSLMLSEYEKLRVDRGEPVLSPDHD
jgi:hypothetical protein